MTPSTPLDDISFLARSPHRVRTLRTLASGPQTRVELHGETGIPQPTLGRALGDFEDRNWVERRSPEYALTPLGALLAEEFEALLDTVETVQKLGGVIERVEGEMDVDVRGLSDATVWEPEPGDGLAHVRRIMEVFYGADHMRVVSPTIAPGTFEEHQQSAEVFLESDRYNEAIVPPRVLREALAGGGWAEQLRMGIESGRVAYYLYDGDIPLPLMLADGTAFLAPTDDQGFPTAIVETENEAVRSWVERQLDEYRARSTAVTADDLPS